MAIITITRKDNENEEQFIWRLGQMKDSGEIVLSWPEIADIVNREFRADESEYRVESAYRKPYQYTKRYFEAGAFNQLNEDEYIKELDIKKRELEKERRRLFDARVDYNKLIRQEARKESYLEMIQRIICENTVPLDIDAKENNFVSNNDLLCHLTDIHTGIEIHNWKNEFNKDILKTRIEKFTQKILDIRKIHNSQDCYLVIGEILSGIIHNNLRLQNNMDLMEQFKYISDLISSILVILSKNFHHVYVFVTPGNHSRISPKKEEALDGENMDLLLPYYLKARMQNTQNVSICDNKLDPEVASFKIRRTQVFAVHGHKDNPSTVVQDFTMMFGLKPNILLMGHRHTNGLSTVYDTKVIQSGCVSGADNYAISIRKANRPEQTVSVVSDDGFECLYDIQLDE